MKICKISTEDLFNLQDQTTKPISKEPDLTQAIQANKRYSDWYDYSKLPIILNIAAEIGKSNNFGSKEFAKNVFQYQVEKMNVPTNKADGQFDPPFIEDYAKKNGIDLSKVNVYWENKLKGNWIGNRWVGRRLEQGKEGAYQWPVKSAQIVGDFTGAKASDKYHEKGHWGMDFGNVSEGTSIFPIAPGKVIDAGNSKIGGIYLKIDHGNGVQSYYAHMNSANVKTGDSVDFDTVIGGVGKTGNAIGSVHLHLEIKIAGTKIDPKKIVGTSIDK